MKQLTLKKIIVLLIHAFIVWALCGAVVAIGRSITNIELTLVLHAIGAPVFAALVSLFYFKKFNYTTPLQTAIIFLFVIIALDAGLVAPFFEKSYEMFESVLGTWIPFALIFLSTLISGLVIKNKN